MRKYLLSFLVFLSAINFTKAQDLVKYKPVKAEIIAGPEALEQVLQTQLSLPKNFFSNGYNGPVTIYFLIDSLGHAHHMNVRVYNKAGQAEFRRIMSFLRFRRMDNDPNLPYELNIEMNAARYNSFIKQKQKPAGKSKIPADSSMVIHARADRSPEYYKGGEEGFKEMLLSEVEYPKLALEKSVEGTVLIEFIVETNGFVTGLNVLKALGAGCTDEALRVIKNTRWQPAQLNGKLVRYKMNYPITFSIQNANRDTGFSNPTGQ